ncbi:CCA tRNA nucleotidyltransferase [Pseudohaliea rubra]|uniref:CCA-adding enzyme n=1 Tax=Pseudohaliea rubra DSM 19751 TaxID=1265313 RepID=A0A095VRW2_9GAMM|nr:CCA tRNA nucleotidyltransferase [Pseudohaliea rubra]KGE03843.1 tRNA nucleotidyltransferase [Pseudohaliea rubra DSM 19751]
METYLVGGAVRDELLGHPFTEKDWVVVGARPEDLLEQGYTPVGKDFPVFLHPESKEEFALARTERKQGHGYTGFAVHAAPEVSLEEDLRRRDLTVNAMARDPDGHLIDPYGGQRDLEARVLRHVSPAFVEDPLRVLRTARFAARYHHLGFHIAPETLALMGEIVTQGELEHLPAERVWTETEKALHEADPAVYIAVLKACGALAALAPELDRRSDAALAQLTAAAAHSDDSALRFAALVHGLEPPALERLCERLKVPRRHRELALLLAAQAGRAARARTLSSEELLVLLEAAGALRDNGRFEAFIEGAAALAGDDFPADYLRRARDLARDVSAASFVAEGLTGKAIGQAMEAERIRRLNALAVSPAGE